MSVVKLNSQTIENSGKTIFYLSAGYAYKYHYSEIHPDERDKNYFMNYNALLINMGLGSKKMFMVLKQSGFLIVMVMKQVLNILPGYFPLTIKEILKLRKSCQLIY